MVSLSKLLLTDSSGLPYILPRLLSYTWEHLEHVMDSVKHLAVTLLHNIAKMQSDSKFAICGYVQCGAYSAVHGTVRP